jgi:flagellar hook-associated protein 1 FlgK
MVDVLTSKGANLVDGVNAYTLVKTPDQTTGMTKVDLQGPSGTDEDITNQISGGSLGALLTNRDTTIPDYLSNLNGLAKSIMQNVNYFHEQGNNSAGIPFFQTSTSNYAQGISLATQISNGSGEFQTQNIMASSSTTEATNNDIANAIAGLANEAVLGGSSVTSTASSSATTALGISGHLVIDGVSITVGAGDSLTSIMNSINGNAALSDSVANGGMGLAASIAQSSGNYQLVLTASNPSDNISVANGDLDTSSQTLLQTLTSTPVTSTGTAMNLSGTVQLGQGKSVTVADTDSLTDVMNNINGYTGTTGITATISGSNTLVLSAGGSPILIPSGTVTGSIGISGATYSDFEAGVVANIGQATKSATDLTEYNQNALTSLQQQQSQESGVSIDDEMSNLIQFQNAYQASARLYTVAQSMIDALLSSVGASTS